MFHGGYFNLENNLSMTSFFEIKDFACIFESLASRLAFYSPVYWMMAVRDWASVEQFKNIRMKNPLMCVVGSRC